MEVFQKLSSGKMGQLARVVEAGGGVRGVCVRGETMSVGVSVCIFKSGSRVVVHAAWLLQARGATRGMVKLSKCRFIRFLPIYKKTNRDKK